MTDRNNGRIMNAKEYFSGWPGKSFYNDDLNWCASIAIQYLRKIAPAYKNSNKIGLVIFDLDDTLFMGDPENVIGIQEMSLGTHNGQEIFILPVNRQIVQVANEARKLGFKIVCLTARPAESKLASVTNLNMFNIPHDMLIMNQKDEDPFFKIKIRRQLIKPNQDIVCTIGDQFTDIYLPGKSTCAIKLPCSDLPCGYAYIP